VLTLYMQQVLHYSALKTGVAYIGLTLTIVLFSGVHSAREPRRSALGAPRRAGAFERRADPLRSAPVHGHYFTDLFPAFLISGLGLALAFVSMSIAPWPACAQPRPASPPG